MSLVIHAGYLLDLDDDDADFLHEERQRIERINEYLRTQNHPPHHEPTDGASELMLSIKSSIMPLYDLSWYLHENTSLDMNALLDMPIEDAFYLPFAVDDDACLILPTPYSADDFRTVGYAPKLKQVSANVLGILDPEHADWFGIERPEHWEKWSKQIQQRFDEDTIRNGVDGALKCYNVSSHAIKNGLIVRIY